MLIDKNAIANMRPQDSAGSSEDDAGGRTEPEVPLPADDEAPVDEEMADVDANNSVSSEYPKAGTNGGEDAAPQMDDQDEYDKEARNMPASDPESGA
ncbi:hypothetical protein D3C76_840170 [compost metagenome]